ncbi:MAG: chorismate-binding protein [Eggerthella lenta]
MLPEVILVEDDRGAYLQVNSLSPVYPVRIARFARQAAAAPRRNRRTIPFKLEPDSRDAWRANVEAALDAIGRGRISKVVLSRRQRLEALEPFSSKDLLVNLIDGPARGTVLLHRYADVFFCGCTPSCWYTQRGNEVESMCPAGTCPAGATEEERARLADELMADAKNRAEHDHVVRFIRRCSTHMLRRRRARPAGHPAAHPRTAPVHARPARMLEGVDLGTMKDDLHPAPPWQARRWARRRC